MSTSAEREKQPSVHDGRRVNTTGHQVLVTGGHRGQPRSPARALGSGEALAPRLLLVSSLEARVTPREQPARRGCEPLSRTSLDSGRSPHPPRPPSSV